MLNERIKQLRLSFGLSQVSLAEKLRVTKQCVSNWENDNVQPSVEMLLQIARFFNVSCDYLLGVQKERSIDVNKLTEEEITHIQLLIKDLTKNR